MSQTASLYPAQRTVQQAAQLLQHLVPPPRNFTIRLWDGTELRAEGRPAFSLVLNHPGAPRRMFRPPLELALGEAFIHGDFDIEGDILAAAAAIDTLGAHAHTAGDLLQAARELWALPNGRPEPPPAQRGPAQLRGARHSRQRDQAAIQYHYDVGNEFYGLWLDRQMQYSCAYFPTGTEDLDTAQQRKLDYLCRKLRLSPGERLLDIGCGWGGLALFAARHFGVEVLGVTLSQPQAEYAAARIAQAGQARSAAVRVQDYRDLGDAVFDKIVSVGMFEHVGRSKLPEYFAQVYRLLKPGGIFLNHGISLRAEQAEQPSRWRRWIEQRLVGTGSFSDRYIFPDGELTPVSEVNAIAERAGFEVRDVENLREHYALTLRHWVHRLEARQAEAVKLVGEVTYRTWRLYLAGAAHGFTSGHLNVNQTLLAKLAPGGQAYLPYSRADWYAPG